MTRYESQLDLYDRLAYGCGYELIYYANRDYKDIFIEDSVRLDDPAIHGTFDAGGELSTMYVLSRIVGIFRKCMGKSNVLMGPPLSQSVFMPLRKYGFIYCSSDDRDSMADFIVSTEDIVGYRYTSGGRLFPGYVRRSLRPKNPPILTNRAVLWDFCLKRFRRVVSIGSEAESVFSHFESNLAPGAVKHYGFYQERNTPFVSRFWSLGKKRYLPSSIKKGIHNPRMKLLMADLWFMTLTGGVGEYVYVGCSPGDHIPLLLDLFPLATMIGIDMRLPERNHPRFEFYQGAVEDHMNIIERKGQRRYLMSDLRSGDALEDEGFIEVDNDLQFSLTAHFQVSMVKFRFPFDGKERTLYVKGVPLLQCYPRIGSAETRMIVSSTMPTYTYTSSDYEERMMFYNDRRGDRDDISGELADHIITATSVRLGITPMQVRVRLGLIQGGSDFVLGDSVPAPRGGIMFFTGMGYNSDVRRRFKRMSDVPVKMGINDANFLDRDDIPGTDMVFADERLRLLRFVCEAIKAKQPEIYHPLNDSPDKACIRIGKMLFLVQKSCECDGTAHRIAELMIERKLIDNPDSVVPSGDVGIATFSSSNVVNPPLDSWRDKCTRVILTYPSVEVLANWPDGMMDHSVDAGGNLLHKHYVDRPIKVGMHDDSYWTMNLGRFMRMVMVNDDGSWVKFRGPVQAMRNALLSMWHVVINKRLFREYGYQLVGWSDTPFVRVLGYNLPYLTGNSDMYLRVVRSIALLSFWKASVRACRPAKSILVIGSPGIGKSHLAKTFPRIFVDCDTFLSWPRVHRFWEVLSPSSQHSLALTHFRAIRDRMIAYPAVYLFGPNLSALAGNLDIFSGFEVTLWEKDPLTVANQARLRIDQANPTKSDVQDFNRTASLFLPVKGPFEHVKCPMFNLVNLDVGSSGATFSVGWRDKILEVKVFISGHMKNLLLAAIMGRVDLSKYMDEVRNNVMMKRLKFDLPMVEGFQKENWHTYLDYLLGIHGARIMLRKFKLAGSHFSDDYITESRNRLNMIARDSIKSFGIEHFVFRSA
jgi:hypothetical protein